LFLVTVALLVTSACAADTVPPPLPIQTDVSLLREADYSVDQAIKFLFGKQNPENGSWHDNPAITGLAVTALLRSPNQLTEDQRARMDKAVEFILKFVRPDGVIGEKSYLNYSTSVCAMALLATGKQEYNDIIKRAREYIQKSQTSEVQGFAQGYLGYGGIGYGNKPEQKDRPDLSNTGFAIEMLALTEGFDTEAEAKTPEVRRLHFKRALTFLQRCQNLPSKDGIGNDQGSWMRNHPDDHGGAIYGPAETRGRAEKIRNEKGEEVEVLIPYGSMTYALLKSYIFCGLTKDDPRVTAAIDWISRHFTLEENPGIGAEGQYYYYMTLAKALSTAQVDWLTLPDGKKVDWRHELVRKLINLQKGDGSWVNDKGRWMENDPVLVTAYSLLAMDVALAQKYP
jgi:squalene-hopene/tetraprenyl-beta-curcumene cyclase